MALDQPLIFNRMGATNPDGMIFALRHDVVALSGTIPGPGNARLRPEKRPRPLTLRMNIGDCLSISFTNWLGSSAKGSQPATRNASVHVAGLQQVGSVTGAGLNVGTNQPGTVPPGGTATYTYYGEREGQHLMTSGGAMTGGEGNSGSVAFGLFGAVNVEPAGSEWYRSQLTAEELQYATKLDGLNQPMSTPAGQPVLNYDAVYPAGHPRAGWPVLKMLSPQNEILHSDLNAIITGAAAGAFPTGTYRNVRVYPNRLQPFREFTIIFHDEIESHQAFSEFEDPVLEFTLHSVRDSFAINYGAAGMGSQILANRKGLGPSKDCVECKFEEFFLSAWVGGDPAMIVDVPANTWAGAAFVPPGSNGATRAYYPDDPSNVYHSYLNDRVKIRNLHAGREHHIFHLHAHQWLHTPDSDNSTYLDSQAIGPGGAYTYEITYNGGGNRNRTVGDSVVHCHFYPHFAQGMWGIWRVHDVFENGTRRLPDPEIPGGSPIPAVVPLPTVAMAPMPTASMPGYPFYIPGTAGHRPPSPPKDLIDDGGLPRHVVTGGQAVHHQSGDASFSTSKARLDWDKVLTKLSAKQLAADGEPAEISAMTFHATRTHPSFTPAGVSANFTTNGLPSQPGAPFADPCQNDAGTSVGNKRVYKTVAFQSDIKLNKAGWHVPQARTFALREDYTAAMNGSRPPQPLFMRVNTGDCVEYQHTNLIPGVYLQDDFQVRTPTDVLGQHIHLVKFDVTSSDGGANGFNYEDGIFSAHDVLERINAIKAPGGSWTPSATGPKALAELVPRAQLGVLGAQTGVQRWYVDEVMNLGSADRTLRTVYTHDHFGPSTHQQTGLYAGVVVEPSGSVWRDSETGETFGTRSDGGPTSWRADIITSPSSNSYREFLLEFQDFAIAYRADNTPVNPPGRKEVWPKLVALSDTCPGGAPRPCPEAISADDPGTMTVNYRNEPIGLRIYDPATKAQAEGTAGDLSYVFRSDVTRRDAAFNVQPPFYAGLSSDMRPGDPFTPLLRAYENDRVQVRVMVGAQEEMHNMSVHGVNWRFEASDQNSGFRNSQAMGISEHYEFVLPPLTPKANDKDADLLYKAGSSTDDLWNGLWGILRQYQGLRADLKALPNNLNGKAPSSVTNDFKGACPKTAVDRNFTISAIPASALPGGTLVYNARGGPSGMLHDPTAMLMVPDSDLDLSNPSAVKLKPGAPVEPLILRAKAGECINITLTNRLPAVPADQPGWSSLPMIIDGFNANDIRPSATVGLHPSLLTFEIEDDGANVGFNTNAKNGLGKDVAGPGEVVTYQWYAGNVTVSPNGQRVATPVEFGAVNISSSDPIKHPNKGLVAGLIIEPRNATWVEDPGTRISATVTNGTATFREFALVFQNFLNLQKGTPGTPVGNISGGEDSEDSGHKALNYRTEPFWHRMNYAAETSPEMTRMLNFSNVLTNGAVGGEPQTPVFTARAGEQVRFRIFHPGGNQRNNVFGLAGHVWEELPYASSSTVIGTNPLSMWTGAQSGHGPSNQFDVVLKNGAGGKFAVPGDYLFRDLVGYHLESGLWGLLRVTP